MHKQARLRRLWVGLMILPLGLMADGCGSSKGTVSGKVTYQGKVVPGGTVSIIPASGGVISGDIKEDGSYTISKVPGGSAKVTVETESAKPVSTNPMQARGDAGYYAKMPKLQPPPGVNPPGEMTQQKDPKRYVPIPDKYRDPEKSGLSLTVKGGNNPFDIELK